MPPRLRSRRAGAYVAKDHHGSYNSHLIPQYTMTDIIRNSTAPPSPPRKAAYSSRMSPSSPIPPPPPMSELYYPFPSSRMSPSKFQRSMNRRLSNIKKHLSKTSTSRMSFSSIVKNTKKRLSETKKETEKMKKKKRRSKSR